MIDPLIIHTVSHWLQKRGVRFVPSALDRLNYFITGCDLPAAVTIGKGVRFQHYGSGCIIHPGVVLKDRVWINPQVVLGQDTVPEHMVLENTIIITVENDVILGAGAKIIARRPLVIGAKSRIGANAVVLKSIPPGVTVVGVPAKILQVPPAVQSTATSDA